MHCIVQTEDSRDIGFLGYTSHFSGKEHIAKEFLSRTVGHKIGVRLASIANKAEHTSWNEKRRQEPLQLCPCRQRKITLDGDYHDNVNIFNLYTFRPRENKVAKCLIVQ